MRHLNSFTKHIFEQTFTTDAPSDAPNVDVSKLIVNESGMWWSGFYTSKGVDTITNLENISQEDLAKKTKSGKTLEASILEMISGFDGQDFASKTLEKRFKIEKSGLLQSKDGELLPVVVLRCAQVHWDGNKGVFVVKKDDPNKYFVVFKLIGMATMYQVNQKNPNNLTKLIKGANVTDTSSEFLYSMWTKLIDTWTDSLRRKPKVKDKPEEKERIPVPRPAFK